MCWTWCSPVDCRPVSMYVRDSVLTTDHRETAATITVPGRRSPLLTRRSVFNYKRADFGGLRRSLYLIPWGLLDGIGVDEAVDIFYDILNSAIADHVPTVVLRRRVPPWFDGAVRAALRLKEAAYRRMRRHPVDVTKTEFADRRREFKTLSSDRYYQYLRGLTADFKTNPKRYWSFLKCVTNKSSVSPVLRASDGNTVTDDQGRAELLSQAFSAKFTQPNVTVLPEAPDFDIDNLSRLHVSEAAVRTALEAVPVNKACGPDNISARIIVECADELVVPIAKICNASISSGVFPERWKQASIIPIHKKGDKKNPSNYRSVSLLPLFGKILERLVYDQLFRHVSPALCNEQHGFIPRRSCVTNLAVYLQSAWEAISDGYQTDTIYTDYSAAFQSVNHSLLIHKLKHSYKLENLALKWFVSYLSDRRQRVIVNGKTSNWTAVLSGVPEGSLLAPLLFSLFINDLPREVNCGCLMYADDVKIFRKIVSPSDGLLLREDLGRLAAWSVRWGLTLNPSKCKSFTITLRRAPVQTAYFINATQLEHVGEIRDLGIILDTKLTFSSHVNGMVSRANRSLGLLFRSFQTGTGSSKFNRNALMCAYFSNVRSILEYGSVIWTGAADTHTVRIDRVQHKFLIWLLSNTASGHARSLDYSALLNHFRIPSLASRRVQHDILFMRNLFNSRVDSHILMHSFSLHAPTRSVRTRRLFYEPRPRVNTVKRGLFIRVPQLVNSFLRNMPEVDFFSDASGIFKAHVLKHISSI